LTPSTPAATIDDFNTEVHKFVSVYDWSKATELIESFVKTTSGYKENKQLLELLGDCYYNLAFQQNTRDVFKEVILRAKDAYDKVAEDNRCKARASFCKYWASDNYDERRQVVISECLPAAREFVRQLDAAEKDEDTDAKAHAELMEYLFHACSISTESKQILELSNEARTEGIKAFARFKTSGNPATVSLIANDYVRFIAKAHATYFDENESQRIAIEVSTDVIPLLDRLIGIAEKSNMDARVRCLAFEAAGRIEAEFKANFSGSLDFWDKAIQLAEETKDQFLIGWELAIASFYLIWVWRGTNIPERAKGFLERALENSSRATEILKVPLAAWELELAYYCKVKSLVELFKVARQEDKRELIQKAIVAGREGTGYEIGFTRFNAGAFADALRHGARLSQQKSEREKLLTEAINATDNELYLGNVNWNRGVALNYLGLLKSELSREKVDPQDREKLVNEAIADLRRSADICATSHAAKGREARVAGLYEDLGNVLMILCEPSGIASRDRGLECIRAYDNAIRYYTEANLIGNVPPITWKIAKLYDSMSDYRKSSNSFTKASQQYQAAATNQKSLQRSFSELSQYMQAWCKIEESRLSHFDEDYLSSSERLREAASLLNNTESFRFLAKHYEGYSAMEQAEDYSRKEKSQEASDSFGLASDLYAVAEQEASEHSKDEDDLNWATISKNRGNYCLARKAMEDAKILDRNAQPEASMRKYRAAFDTLNEIIGQARKQGGEVGDVEALAISCDAFATMKEAEYKSSPQLYAKSSELFSDAKESPGVKQSFVLSCLANSAICEAFEAGTRFKKTSDVNLYSEIKTKLGIASRYYEEAGFEIASDWTSATEALFDALAYLAGAERELDSTKKTQMYHLAEKHLELSARKYGDIGYDKKRQEVLRQLKKARENRELLITPMEALSQSPTVSSTPLNFTSDQATGLERFEVANLTGNISLSTKQTSVGSAVRVEIDIANVGKTPALLMKLDSLAPSDGFEIDAKNNPIGFQNFLVDGNSVALDLKGKRLEYLKSHEVTIHLVAKSGGNFQLKPRILYVDELGKYRSYEFESQIVQVSSTEERKLAAIMFTDMAGYTALGQKNETLSIALVNEQRNLLRPIFKRHNGREIKTIGDAFLVEFASALDAVRCAYDIQRATREFNISLPQDKRITLRVGVHVGDVVKSADGDISGDTVNVASRIEPLAEQGGVCITRQVYDNIQNKFDLKLQSLGLKTLKHVNEPLEVFKMVMPWE
jgi:class 3 adenylate cyclase